MNVTELKNCISGGAFLGSGGGGNVSIARKLVKKYTSLEEINVELVTMEEYDESKLCAVVAFIGSPDSFGENPDVTAVVNAFLELQKQAVSKYGKEIGYLIPVELGAVNSLISFLVAHELNVKNAGSRIAVLDGDGAGRAIPCLPLTTFAAQNISTYPGVICNDDGLAITLSDCRNSKENVWGTEEAETLEKLIRPVLGLPQFEEIAGIGLWAMDKTDVASTLIRNSVSSMLKIGEYLNKTAFEEVSAKELQKLYRKFVPSGEVSALESCRFDSLTNITEGGFDHGVVLMTRDGGNQYSLLFQNETLITWQNDREAPAIVSPFSCNMLFDTTLKHLYGEDEFWGDNTASGVSLSNGDIQEKHLDLVDFRVKLFCCSPAEPLLRSPISDNYHGVLGALGYYGK